PSRRALRGGSSERYARLWGGIHSAYPDKANGWQPESVTYSCARSALKGMGLIGKKGKTAGVPLLVRSVAAQATFPPAKSRHTRLSCWMNRQPHRSPDAHCAPLRQSAFALPCTPGAFVTGSPPRKA